MSNQQQTLEAIVSDRVFSCTTIVQAHTTKETDKPTQYIITLKSPKEMAAKLGLTPASITITIKAEADVAKEIFPQDHAFKITFQKTSLHYNPNPDSQRQDSRQSTLLIDQTNQTQTDPEPEAKADQTDQTNQPEAEIDPETGTAFWSYEEESKNYAIDDETCEAPNQ